jgi:hypothetical protein
MFSLIITIVSIALVVALVAATMYHGGDTLTQGRTTADAAAFVSGAQQIGGAQVMHISLESAPAADVAGLVTDKYLASTPVVKGTGWTLDTATKLVKNVALTKDVCLAINKSAGVPKATLDTGIVAAADFAGLPYGCDTATLAFSFKY